MRFVHTWGEGPYIERVAAHETHAHRRPAEHLMLGEGGGFLLFVEPLRVLEHVPRLEIVLHGVLLSVLRQITEIRGKYRLSPYRALSGGVAEA